MKTGRILIMWTLIVLALALSSKPALAFDREVVFVDPLIDMTFERPETLIQDSLPQPTLQPQEIMISTEIPEIQPAS